MTRSERANRLRPLVREAVARTSYRTVGDAVGLSHNAVFGFVEKNEVPYEKTLRKYEEWLQRGQEAGDGGDAEAAEMFLSQAGAMAMLGGIAPRGEAPEDKRTALELIRGKFAREGVPLPGWWYDLLRGVDAGEL